MPQTMLGPYRLELLLGRGGMGEVYRAYDTEQDRRVALKVLPAALSRDPEYRGRFRREARLASGLTDPHVVPIHRYGEIDGQLFLDMRLVEGEDLEAVLRREGRLAPEAAVRLVEQVASALDAAHGHGLVHRDVKPSNVFLTRPGSPDAPRFAYLGDFGIARSLSSTSAVLTATGTAVGTPDYMAPERFAGEAVDGRADVYSLAALLHECLTGQRPFVRDGLAALMHAHMFAPPPRPSTSPGVPAGFDAVVTRGMAKDPGQRPSTAGALAAHARAVLTEGRGAARPVLFTDDATSPLVPVPRSAPGGSLPGGTPAPGPDGAPRLTPAPPAVPSLQAATPQPGFPPPQHAVQHPPWAPFGPPAVAGATAMPTPAPAAAQPASRTALVLGLAGALGLLVPAPALNVIGFCVVGTVLGAATMGVLARRAQRPGRRVVGPRSAAAVAAVGSVVVALVLTVALVGTPYLQATLVVLSLALLAVWAAARNGAGRR